MLSAPLKAQEWESPLDRVLTLFNESIVFHAGFEGDAAQANLAAGRGLPLAVEGEVSFADGIVGSALANGVVTFEGGRNLDFSMPGTLLLWVSISREISPPESEGYAFPLRAYGSDASIPHGMLMLGKIDKANGCGLYVHIEASGQKSGNVRGPGTLGWRVAEWHMLAITWRQGVYELSTDGQTPVQRKGPLLPSASSRFMLAAHSNPTSNLSILIDEMTVFDRPLDAGEIAWIWRTMMGIDDPQ